MTLRSGVSRSCEAAYANASSSSLERSSSRVRRSSDLAVVRSAVTSIIRPMPAASLPGSAIGSRWTR